MSPALPAGLSLDGSSGTISGTPSAVAPTETYTVTAWTGTANAVAEVSITVDAVAPWPQFIPNMDQTITPLAPSGCAIPTTQPRPGRQSGVAGYACGYDRSESGWQHAAGSDQWV